jgi:hypothetical protein
VLRVALGAHAAGVSGAEEAASFDARAGRCLLLRALPLLRGRRRVIRYRYLLCKLELGRRPGTCVICSRWSLLSRRARQLYWSLELCGGLGLRGSSPYTSGARATA